MGTQITPPRVDLIDPKTGQISRPWYLFFLSLYQATGSGGSTISLDDLLVGPPSLPGVSYDELAALVGQFSVGGVLPTNQPFTQSDHIDTSPIDLSPLSDKIDGLSVAPVAQPQLAPTTGRAVLVAGTVTVANPNVTAASNIMLTSQADGGVPGWIRVSARTAGTSFTISSSSVADTSTIAYQIN